jgi:hypothetical protein
MLGRSTDVDDYRRSILIAMLFDRGSQFLDVTISPFWIVDLLGFDNQQIMINASPVYNQIGVSGFSICVIGPDGVNIKSEPLRLMTVSVVFTVNVLFGKKRSEMNSETGAVSVSKRSGHALLMKVSGDGGLPHVRLLRTAVESDLISHPSTPASHRSENRRTSLPTSPRSARAGTKKLIGSGAPTQTCRVEQTAYVEQASV